MSESNRWAGRWTNHAAAVVLTAAAGAVMAADDATPAGGLDIRQHLRLKQWYAFTSKLDLSGNWSGSSSRGGRSGTVELKTDIAAQFVVDEEDAGRALQVRARFSKYHVIKHGVIVEPADADRDKEQRAKKLDPDDHPLLGHWLLYDRSSKPPTLADLGTDGARLPTTAPHVEKSCADLVAVLEEIVSPAWSENAPADAVEGKSWTFDAVRFLRFCGAALPQRALKPERAMHGECKATIRRITGNVVDVDIEPVIDAMWNTDKFQYKFKGRMTIDVTRPGAVTVDLPPGGFAFDASPASGIRASGPVSAGMNLAKDPEHPSTPDDGSAPK